MGCDIHLHIEMKVKGKWLHYGCPYVDRNYYLFAKMANVRNYRDIVPISEPRGFPCDGVSEITKVCFEHDKPFVHSISWLDAKELDDLRQWYNDRHPITEWRRDWNHHCIHTYLCGNDLDYDVDGIEDVRLVFWFDN